MDKADHQVLENIQKFGCQVMHIAAEDDLPPFAYSVGIQQTTSAPEVLVIGLKQPMAHFVVNEYNNRVRNGEKFVPGQKYSGFLGDFDVLVDRDLRGDIVAVQQLEDGQPQNGAVDGRHPRGVPVLGRVDDALIDRLTVPLGAADKFLGEGTDVRLRDPLALPERGDDRLHRLAARIALIEDLERKLARLAASARPGADARVRRGAGRQGRTSPTRSGRH